MEYFYCKLDFYRVYCKDIFAEGKMYLNAESPIALVD